MIKAFIDCEDRIYETVSDPTVMNFIMFLGRLEMPEFQSKQTQDRRKCLITVFNGGEIFVPAEGLIDLTKQRLRLQRDLAEAESSLGRGEAQLANPNFVARAPAEEVERFRKQIDELKKRIALLKRNLEGLS
jgi:valyl-tRNA synthetase